jgi:hypothetical protein
MTISCTQRQFGFGLMVCMSAVTFSTISYAYTAEQQRLCSSDAFRFCSSAIPNVGRVTICMRKHKASLSDGCKAVFDRPEPTSSTNTDAFREKPQ